jgi:DNA polymerase V
MTVFRNFNLPKIEILPASTDIAIELPFVKEGISAGFPSPADDFIDTSIDLNHELIKHPSATFFGKVRGNSMKDLGIHDGDLLVIDKSLEPATGKVAVCYIDGEFTVKSLKIEKESILLLPANTSYKPILVTKENDFLIWGIVTNVIKYF